MKCVVCKVGQTRSSTTTVTLQREGTTLVLKGVPAEVCSNCGEAYVDEGTTAKLLGEAQEAIRAGVQVRISEYASVR
jgi:YgiT-type zinc finger domain-containing protein